MCLVFSRHFVSQFRILEETPWAAEEQRGVLVPWRSRTPSRRSCTSTYTVRQLGSMGVESGGPSRPKPREGQISTAAERIVMQEAPILLHGFAGIARHFAVCTSINVRAPVRDQYIPGQSPPQTARFECAHNPSRCRADSAFGSPKVVPELFWITAFCALRLLHECQPRWGNWRRECNAGGSPQPDRAARANPYPPHCPPVSLPAGPLTPMRHPTCQVCLRVCGTFDAVCRSSNWNPQPGSPGFQGPSRMDAIRYVLRTNVPTPQLSHPPSKQKPIRTIQSFQVQGLACRAVGLRHLSKQSYWTPRSLQYPYQGIPSWAS